jgi:hypothetical protein
MDVIAARLPGGTKVAIRYNPKKPAMSMAEISTALFDEDAMIRLGVVGETVVSSAFAVGRQMQGWRRQDD